MQTLLQGNSLAKLTNKNYSLTKITYDEKKGANWQFNGKFAEENFAKPYAPILDD